MKDKESQGGNVGALHALPSELGGGGPPSELSGSSLDSSLEISGVAVDISPKPVIVRRVCLCGAELEFHRDLGGLCTPHIFPSFPILRDGSTLPSLSPGFLALSTWGFC